MKPPTLAAEEKARLEGLAAIVASSDDAIVGTDLSGNVIAWNRAAERMFGYPAEEMIGATVRRLVPTDREDEDRHILSEIRRGRGVRQLQTRRLTKAGRLIDVSVTTSPIRDADRIVVGVSNVVRDITDWKLADDARRTSEARYRTLFDYAPDGILIADPTGHYVDANPAVCRMLGYAREELLGLSAADIVAPSETQFIEPGMSAVRRRADYHREWQMRRKDGTIFPAELIATVMPDGLLLGMLRDSTERNRSEARLRRLVESNAQGVMFWNSTGIVTGANDAFLDMLGYTREDLEAGKINWTTMTPPEHAEADERCNQELVGKGVCTPYEKEYIRKDGSRVPVFVGAATFADNPNEGVRFVLDLTEQKTLERQFFRAQRMESIGTLAGGIAHDLNNVFAPILLSVAVLRHETHDAGLRDVLDTLQLSAQRGADLVKQVLSFARGVERQAVTVNLLHVMRDLIKVIGETFPRSIEIRFEPEHNLWTITADPTQMHQVFLNLCVNARDAMPNGGRLTVTMENIVVDETYAAMNIDAQAGVYVLVTVADTGVGISPEDRERIFEPFFTTKAVGVGTGLGLSTTLAIVKSHGGFMNLYSEIGRGTKFKVHLPARAAGAVPTESVAGPADLPRGNGEVILVVDDEAAIRRIATATLERFGYRVMSASNGAEAVALFAVHRSEIAVVVTDMAMPVMDGPATIVALKAIDPTVKIIASSGYTSTDGMAKALGAGVQRFVPKPYTADILLATLRDVIHEG